MGEDMYHSMKRENEFGLNNVGLDSLRKSEIGDEGNFTKFTNGAFNRKTAKRQSVANDQIRQCLK